MPGRRNYEKAVREGVRLYAKRTGVEVLEYISRPGEGEAPRYVFTDKTCLGGPEALQYVQGLLDGLDERQEVSHAGPTA